MYQRKIVKNRPKNLNLLTIRLPVNAIVSIMHRASGVVLFLIQPLLLWALQRSLSHEAGYAQVAQLFDHYLLKLMVIGLGWAFFHHFYAGLRHLSMDVHWMTSLQKARFSSRVVLWLVALSVALFAWAIW